MTGTEVIEAARDAILTVVLISAPLLIAGTIVGVAVSLFQALTQIQEMTLTYVPKIIATFVVFLFALPFMADASHRQFLRVVAHISGVGKMGAELRCLDIRFCTTGDFDGLRGAGRNNIGKRS
ncbi:flagellar biosynthetic protein FliQ [Afipia broomeae ATCC 49717]|uniref:Flagellar biosynthetic protein FliQ n=1 Tax=Afipia broomeae ATCC 49717 TaxID=883078 RepID=K8P179_9BRAD|nr:flagellar biosynthetic protein FliQ [Afipia broomeae ATCC 49717]